MFAFNCESRRAIRSPPVNCALTAAAGERAATVRDSSFYSAARAARVAAQTGCSVPVTTGRYYTVKLQGMLLFSPNRLQNQHSIGGFGSGR